MRGADYVLKRTAFAIVTVFVAITLNFVLFRALPGNAIANFARVPHASPQLRHALAVEFGLDKSKWAQYVIYLKQLFHLNLGISFADQQPVRTELARAIGNTLPMVAAGTLFAILIGTITGVLSAWRRGGIADHISTNAAIAFYSFPTQWLGLMILIIFAGVLPTSGMTNPFVFSQTFLQHLKDVGVHMILPSLTLGLTLYGEYTLIVRS